MSVSLHEPEIACGVSRETANQYLPTAAELQDDPLIHRLMLAKRLGIPVLDHREWGA